MLRYNILMARFSSFVRQSQYYVPQKITKSPEDFLKLQEQSIATMTTKLDNFLNDPRRHFDYETLISKKKDGALYVIDVRQPEELAATGVIPGSVNIPLTELEDAFVMSPDAFRIKYGVDKPSKGTLIVFSCQSGRRSVTALGKALTHGYLNAGNYKGGWLDWESNIRPQQ